MERNRLNDRCFELPSELVMSFISTGSFSTNRFRISISRAFRVFTVTPVFFTLALGCAFQSGVLAQDENLANQPKVVDADKAKKDADKIIADLEAQIKKQREDLELLKLFASSLAEIERSYVQKVDRRRLVEAAIDGMLHDLDRYSDYVPPEELESFQTGYRIQVRWNWNTCGEAC